MTDISGYIEHNYYVSTLSNAEHRAPLSGTIEADVCVVGGGLAGLNTALGLQERGKSAVVLEARRIGWGASGRNAGFVAKGYSASEMSLLERLETPHAQRLVTLTQNARLLIKKRISDFNIDCGPLTPGVLTVSWKPDEQKTRAYIDRANDVFHAGFEYWPREKVREACKTEKYFDGVYSSHDYQFNPLRYLHGIAGAVAQKGGRIFEDSAAVKIAKDGKGWRVETAQGCVRAAHVVLCCSIYIDGLDKRLANAAFPVQTYIMVTKPIEEKMLERSLNTLHAIYDTRFCSDYYRRVDGNRILWGGRVALWSRPHNIAQMMQNDMFKVYPQLKGHVEPEYYWAGLLCYAPHKMPQLGQIEPGYWYNTGFGGHGLAPTTACGEVMAAAIAEGDTAWKDFSPFGIGYAGGKLGRYVAQMVYWSWRARDVFLV